MQQQRDELRVPSLPTPLLARLLLPLVDQASGRDAIALATLAAARRVSREWRDAANLALRALSCLTPHDALALTIALSGRLPALRSLCLSRCYRNAPPGLLACAPFAQLTSLDLSDCGWVTPKKLAKLAGAGRLPSLTRLDLSRCASAKLQACGAAAGAALLPLAPRLRVLALERSAFPPASVLHLAPALTSLEELSLAGCLHLHLHIHVAAGGVPLGGAEHVVAAALGALAPHGALRRLDISSCEALLLEDGVELGPLWAVLPRFAGTLAALDVSDCGMHGWDDALCALLTPELPGGGGVNTTTITQEYECTTTPEKLGAWSAMVRRFDELASWMHSADQDDSCGVALLGGTRGFVLAQVHVAPRRRRGGLATAGMFALAAEPNAMALLPLVRARAGPLHTRWEAAGEAQVLPIAAVASVGTALSFMLTHAARIMSDAGDAAPRHFFELSEPRASDPRIGEDGAPLSRSSHEWPLRAADAEMTPLLLALARAAEALDAPVFHDGGAEEEAEALPLRTAWLDCVAVAPGAAAPMTGAASALPKRAPLEALPAPAWLRPGALCAAWGHDCAGCRAWRHSAT
jgi:hypothetical protein